MLCDIARVQRRQSAAAADPALTRYNRHKFHAAPVTHDEAMARVLQLV